MAGIPCAASSPKHPIISPLPVPLSPPTHQLVSHNPQLAGLIAEQLRMACLQQLVNNGGSQLPVQTAPVASNSHTPSVTVAQETPVMHTEAKDELSDTVIIPASPPMGDSTTTDVSSLCESPPLFNSPVKQPLTSTQINTDFEMKKLDKLSGTHGPEALEITGVVKLEQHNTVVSLSSREIELPPNLTACNQTDSTVNSAANESFPEHQRQSLRKRNEMHKMENFRHTKKHQHRKQPV